MASTDNQPGQPDTDVASQPRQDTVNVQMPDGRFRPGRVVIATALVLGVLVASFLLYRMMSLLLLLFLALLVATAIEPLVNRLRRGPFTRSAGILIVYTGLFVVLAGIGYLLFAVFFSQLGDLGNTLGKKVADMQSSVSHMPNGFMKQQLGVFVDAAQFGLSRIASGSTPLTNEAKLEAVTGTTLAIAEGFFAVTTVFVIAFYWLTERTRIKRAFITWFSPRAANRIRRVWDDIEVKVGGWVRGQLLLMAMVGSLSAVGYFVLGLQYWTALALFIGLAEAIPLVGPYIGTAPAVLVAFAQERNDGLLALLGFPPMDSWVRALLVIIFALLLQNVEGNVLVPRVMKNSVGISPLAVLLSILVGALLAGLAGALVAVPLAGAVQVILADLKAAKEGEAKLEDMTASAEATRAREGELVVAYPSRGETQARVEGNNPEEP